MPIFGIGLPHVQIGVVPIELVSSWLSDSNGNVPNNLIGKVQVQQMSVTGLGNSPWHSGPAVATPTKSNHPETKLQSDFINFQYLALLAHDGRHLLDAELMHDASSLVVENLRAPCPG